MQHDEGRALVQCLEGLRGHVEDGVAVLVLDAGEDHRLDVDALVGEGREGRGDLLQRQVGHAQAERRHGVQRAFHPHVTGQHGDRRRAVLLHEPRGDGVHGVGQRVLQRDHAAVAAVAVLRAPVGLALGHVEADLLVGQLGAGVHALADGRGVDEGLEGGTHLPARLGHVVVLEMLEVGTAHPGLHEAGVRVQRQQAALQEALVVADAVVGAQHGVHLTLPAEHPHGHRLVEGGLDLLLAEHRPPGVAPALLRVAVVVLGAFVLRLHDVRRRTLAVPALLAGEDPVAFRALPGRVHDGVDLLLRHPPIEGAVLLLPEVPPEVVLKLGAQVLLHGPLRVALHAAVQRGVDAQAVGVQVVGLPVGLGQQVVALLVLLAEQVLQLGAQHLAVVGRGTFRVVHPLEAQAQWQLLERIVLLWRERAVLHHLCHHHHAAVQGGVRPAQGVEERGVLEHAHQHGRLLHPQAVRGGVEIDPRRAVDPHRLVDPVEAVQVHGDDLVLGVLPFQPRGDDPLLELLEHPLEEVRRPFGEQELGQLLGDGAGAALPAHVHGRPHGAAQVHPAVLAEALILRGDQSIHHVGADLLVLHGDAVLPVVLPHLGAVAEEDGRGQVAARVLQVGGAGKVAACGQEQHEGQAHTRA